MVTCEGDQEQDGEDRDRNQTSANVFCYIVLTFEPYKLKTKLNQRGIINASKLKPEFF